MRSWNFVEKNEKDIINESLYNSFISKDFKKFWRDIRKIKGSVDTLPAIIDKCNNNHDIANHFHEKFKKVLDNNLSQRRNDGIEGSINNMIESRDSFYITMNDINNAISKLNMMKGPDNIHAGHFKYA